MLNPEWLLLATSCKHIKTGFDSQLHALRERQRTVLSMCLKAGTPISEATGARDLRWHFKQLTHSDMLAFGYLASSGSMGSLQQLWLGGNVIGDAGMIAFADALKSTIGSLRLLTVLSLVDNQIGDAGMIEFSRAIASGSMGQLEVCAHAQVGKP